MKCLYIIKYNSNIAQHGPNLYQQAASGGCNVIMIIFIHKKNDISKHG